MLGLYLLAAHMLGDFVLADRWQAANKFRTDTVGFEYRIRHVLSYSVPFVPIAVIYSPDAGHAGAFMACLFTLHFLTDSRRYLSTLGDVVQWRWDAHVHPDAVKQEWLEYVVGHSGHGPRVRDVSDQAVRWPTPNPWPAAPIMIDQTLHFCQLALLAGLFLA